MLEGGVDVEQWQNTIEWHKREESIQRVQKGKDNVTLKYTSSMDDGGDKPRGSAVRGGGGADLGHAMMDKDWCIIIAFVKASKSGASGA